MQEIHQKQLNDVEEFKSCHQYYLKAGERFDQKMELIVNMEIGLQTVVNSMKTTSRIVDQMVALNLHNKDAKDHDRKNSVDGSLNLSAGRETQTQLQSDMASDDQTQNEDKMMGTKRLSNDKESANYYQSQMVGGAFSPDGPHRSQQNVTEK